jgi:tetratricopeptide (TPR) repeat protein
VDAQTCGRCGRRLLDGRCPLCSHTALGRFIHHEITVLIMLCVIAAAGFLVTRAAARAAERQKAADADTWFRAGARALDEVRLSSAVSALRRASSMDRERRDYRLALARALASDGQDEAAHGLLTQLRTEAPEDPAPNLALARLEARRDRASEAVAYYRRALYGAWEPERLPERERLRVELIRYLLQRNMEDRALAELLVLSADVPEVPDRQIEAADLLLEAGEPARARALYTRALRIEGQNVQAIAGAARAAIDLGDFAAVSRLLRAAEAPTAEISELRAVVDLVRASDPLEPRIPATERRRRVTAALAWAANHAGACAPPGSDAAAVVLADVQSLQLSLQTTPPGDLLGLAESAVLAIGRIDDTLVATCPARAPADRAWLLMARRHAAASS